MVLKVLIADDHSVVRRGVKDILAEALTPLIIGEASNGPDALAQALAGEWDVVLLDISMPGMGGMEVLRRLKQERPNTKVIMLSMHAGSTYVQAALRYGASGYLSKESAPEELLAAVQAVMAGQQYLSRSLLNGHQDLQDPAQPAPGASVS